MAQMTIMLRRDPQTGKQNIIIKLDSDADALPHEHEQMHRQLVEKLIGPRIRCMPRSATQRSAAVSNSPATRRSSTLSKKPKNPVASS